MPQVTRERLAPENRILAALSSQEYKQLVPELEPFPLIFGAKVFEPDEIIRHVYFPTSGIVSLLATTGQSASLEVGIVGNEGMVGVSAFMGVKTSPTLAVVQGAGSALRMKVGPFRKTLENGSGLPFLLLSYTHSLLTQISQAAVCNRFHPIDARLARWLLMTRDRMGAEEFRVTQEFLSNMLGVRREGVNRAAGILQRKNLISYSRGTLTILKRASLEAVACECYKIIKDEYRRA